jgi:hypothetical protein
MKDSGEVLKIFSIYKSKRNLFTFKKSVYTRD